MGRLGEEKSALPCLPTPQPSLLLVAQGDHGHIVLLSPVSIKVTVDRNVSQQKMDAGFVP